jgi:protein-tyrosine phosphatase
MTDMMNNGDPGSALSISINAARYNLRDYGGYAAASGLRLRDSLLFRSGELDNALPADRGLLARLGIGAVVDLRSGIEAVVPRSCAYENFTGPIFVAVSEDGVIPHALQALVKLQCLTGVREHMIRIYCALPNSIRFRQSLTLYFETLLKADGATLIHCFAGKDRTGLAVALFHLFMGVHMDDVFADYLLTNAAGEVRITAGIAALKSNASADVREDVLREAMGVQPDYLAAALNAITSQIADPAAWVQTITGLGPDEVEMIKARYLS